MQYTLNLHSVLDFLTEGKSEIVGFHEKGFDGFEHRLIRC